MTTETKSETTTDPRDHPGWSYAPLIAFAVSSLFLPFVIIFDTLFYGGRTLSSEDLFFLVFLSAVNSGFAGLFFVTRWKLTKAIEQRLPVRSIKAAMWSSLILMGIVASIPYLVAWIGPMGHDPHEKGLGVGFGIIMGLLLVLQFFVMPLVGVYGWFKGRRFYPDDPVKVEEDNTALDAIVERWHSKQG
jgi:hypothetical protein